MTTTKPTYRRTAVSSLFTAHHSLAARYTFSAKERDTETGLSYFGARYYSSDLSIWLSVDPMSDKYPSLSPYVYCADNPVRLVDPNGEEWYVNEDGDIKRGENVDDCQFYFVKGHKDNNNNSVWGEKQVDSKGNCIAVDLGSSIVQSTGLVSDKDNVDHSFDEFIFTNDEAGQKFLRCASRYTDVEWSFWKDETSGTHLSTTHIGDTDLYGGSKAKKSGEGGTLIFFFHTHPRKETLGTLSNELDKGTRNKILEKSPNAVIGFMHQGVLYDLETFKINWDGTRR